MNDPIRNSEDNASEPHARRVTIAFILLFVCAASRLLLQTAVMPPYAGLDELYHAARLAFVSAEGRNPTSQEPSIPLYLQQSLDDDAGSLPDFATLGARWPQRVRKADILAGAPVPKNIRPYSAPNYEAQQPSLYYSIAGPLAGLIPGRTSITELRLWRLLSALLAVITVLGAGMIGYRFFNLFGVLAAALLVSLPTWLTLVSRASNDSICCAMIAAGMAMTLSKPRTRSGVLLEGLFWSLAVATKLYSWPALVLLPTAWWIQKASRKRMMVTAAFVALAAGLTIYDLNARTSNALGLFAFDPSAKAASSTVSIDLSGMARIWMATAIWTSGQHWNALRGAAMVAYALPLLAALVIGAIALWKKDRSLASILGMVVVAFALAQSLNAAAFIIKAHRAGLSLPAGGKEGWYWYALAPLLLCVVAAALRALPVRPLFAVLLCVWIAAWDVAIAEGGLFRDYAGLTSPQYHSALFRWGTIPQQRVLPETAVGPLAGARTELRFVHLGALCALITLTIRRRETDTPP